MELLPDLASTKLRLLSAPANLLNALPATAGPLERLEVHGNAVKQNKQT